jgi:hypothetical protein
MKGDMRRKRVTMEMSSDRRDLEKVTNLMGYGNDNDDDLIYLI